MIITNSVLTLYYSPNLSPYISPVQSSPVHSPGFALTHLYMQLMCACKRALSGVLTVWCVEVIGQCTVGGL